MKWSVGFILFSTLGCKTIPSEEFDNLQKIMMAMAHARQDYTLQPGDTLKVVVYRGAEIAREFEQTITVQPDGKITLVNLTQPVDTKGLTVDELQAKIKELYGPFFQRQGGRQEAFEVTVQFLTSPKAQWLPDQVFVGGQVRRPSAVPYRRGLTLIQSITDAGGWNFTANESRVVLLRMDSKRKTIAREIDCAAVVTHELDDIEVFPGDVVFVPLSFIARVNLFVEFYIRGLIPINPSIIRTFATGL